jgi:hypothetical protein
MASLVEFFRDYRSILGQLADEQEHVELMADDLYTCEREAEYWQREAFTLNRDLQQALDDNLTLRKTLFDTQLAGAEVSLKLATASKDLIDTNNRAEELSRMLTKLSEALEKRGMNLYDLLYPDNLDTGNPGARAGVPTDPAFTGETPVASGSGPGAGAGSDVRPAPDGSDDDGFFFLG